MKQGKIKLSAFDIMITSIILFIVIIKTYGVLVPEAQTAGNELNDTGAPLSGLFESNGMIFVLIMAALLLVVIKSFTKFDQKGK